MNSKKPGKITRKNREFQETLIAANISNNNDPDITKVKGSELENIDLLTYSFPCQGLSVANMGRDKGIKEDADSTSNLIWQIRRILLEAIDANNELPKYLLMENVKNLISKKHIKDYERWVDFLDSIGYSTMTMTLNGFEHGSLQRRERVFAISVLNKRFDEKEMIKIFETKYSNKLSNDERKDKYFEILNSSDGEKDEIKAATPNKTPSRKRMARDNHDLFSRSWHKKEKEWTFNTLTTKQDRHPNIGMIALPKNLITDGKLHKRFITPREAYQIMGFESEDFSKVKEEYIKGNITKESLYRQAGNSIVVSVLEDIFKFIWDIERGVYE